MSPTLLTILLAALRGNHPRFAVTTEAGRFIVSDRGRVLGTAGSASGAADLIAKAP